MSQSLQPVRGTHDLIGDEARWHRYVCEVAREQATLFGAQLVSPPIFEFSEVFHRTLGETSDVVSKETYTFEDRGGESLTLRPEFTASVVRAFISGGYTQQLPFKAFYAGPAFRYERPQKGRLRQFHQIGMEVLGAEGAWYDVEVIHSAVLVLKALGLGEQVTLELNSLGDLESRQAYRERLVAYLTEHQAKLSEESRERLSKNPLRVLDSKQAEDKDVIAGAPMLSESFTPASKVWWDEVLSGLDALGIDYRVSDRLVRGLDYYTHTVFEFTMDSLGSQNTVLAGGRYDGLVKQMGGPEIPGIGWAAGIERLVLAMQSNDEIQLPKQVTSVAVLPIGDAMVSDALRVAANLRAHGVASEMIVKGNVGKAMKKASSMQAAFVVMLGEDEAARCEVTVKHLSSGEQETVAQSALMDYITR